MENGFERLMELANKVDFRVNCHNRYWGFNRLGEGVFEIVYKDNMVVRCEDHQIVDAAWGYVFDNTHLYQVLRSVLEQIPGVSLDAKTIHTDDCLVALGYTEGSVYIGEVPGCEGMDQIYERAWIASKGNKENPETRDYVVYWDQGNSWCSVQHEIIGVTPEQFVEQFKKEMAEHIRQTPFMERTGEAQKFLFDYWFFHVKEMKESIWSFLGMTMNQYRDWRDGKLQLEDGSYNEMEKSSFRLSKEAFDIANEIIRTANDYFLTTDYLFSQADIGGKTKHLLAKLREAILLKEPWAGFIVEFHPGRKTLSIFDAGEDVVAVMVQNTCLYKEDFAAKMKEQGLKATEQNFKQVWAMLGRHILKEGSLEKGAMAAISEVVFEKWAECDKGKPSLDDKMVDAGSRVLDSRADPSQQKEGNLER